MAQKKLPFAGVPARAVIATPEAKPSTQSPRTRAAPLVARLARNPNVTEFGMADAMHRAAVDNKVYADTGAHRHFWHANQGEALLPAHGDTMTRSSVSLTIVFYEPVYWGPMRQVPAEINFHRDDLASPDSRDLAVTEAMIVRLRLVNDVRPRAVLKRINLLEFFHFLTIRPASREIGVPIELIVDRARKAVVSGQQCLDRIAIFVDIGLQSGPGYYEW